MTIPSYQEVMLPLLKFVSDGRVYSMRENYDKLAEEFQLSDEEREKLLPSGTQRVFDNRVGWARTYLKKGWITRITKERLR